MRDKLSCYTHIRTPEGVDIALVPAGPVVRAQAYLIDLLIRGVVLVLFSISVRFLLGKTGVGLSLVLFFLMEWFYPVAFDMWRGGVTPGKKRMKLRTLRDTGAAMTWEASILRNLLRGVDMLPVGYVAALITMMTNRSFKRLGDVVAGTLVVIEAEKTLSPLPVAEGSRDFPAPLSREEKAAIVNFSRRASVLSPSRQIELAEILAPWLECKGKDAVVALHQIANGLTGKNT